MILIIISVFLFYLNDKNIYKCYTSIIDNLFDEKIIKKLNRKIVIF